jgi:hypothetical protein
MPQIFAVPLADVAASYWLLDGQCGQGNSITLGPNCPVSVRVIFTQLFKFLKYFDWFKLMHYCA